MKNYHRHSTPSFGFSPNTIFNFLRIAHWEKERHNETHFESLENERKQRFTAPGNGIGDFRVSVKTYHANKVVLVGSLLDERRFDIHSDIDLCVQGFLQTVTSGCRESLLQASPFDIDLIPMEHGSER